MLIVLAIIGFFVRCSEESDAVFQNPRGTSVEPIIKQTIPNFKPAETEEEFFKLMDNPRANIIRSTEELLQRAEEPRSVYAKLDRRTLAAFTSSLRFKNRGLSTARYDVIKQALPNELDYKAFWEGFGISDTFMADHKDYKCTAVGNCHASSFDICTSNC